MIKMTGFIEPVLKNVLLSKIVADLLLRVDVVLNDFSIVFLQSKIQLFVVTGILSYKSSLLQQSLSIFLQAFRHLI